MLIRDFTAGDYPGIIAVHRSLNIAWPERPRTPEAWEQVDRGRSPKVQYRRWVAEQDGCVVGFAAYGQSLDDYHPQKFSINVEVHSDFQRRGIGSSLYQQVWNALQPFDPRVLRADAFTNLPRGFAFLQKRGFYEAFRETPVHLDISAFDPAPYTGLEADLAAKGITLHTLRDLEGDPLRDRKVFDLYWGEINDIPHEGEEMLPPDYDDWVNYSLHDPTTPPDAFFVARMGDEYIGLRELGVYPGDPVLLGGLLAVRRAHRRHHIGLALQLRGIAFARANGYALLKTCTAVQNLPMQRLFDKLGYARDPEWQQCQKDIL